MRRAFETLGQDEWDKASDETKNELLGEYESEEARDMHLVNMIKEDEMKEGLQRHKKSLSLKSKLRQSSGSQSTTSSDSHLFISH